MKLDRTTFHKLELKLVVLTFVVIAIGYVVSLL